MTTTRVRVEGDLYHGRIPAAAVYVGRQAPGLRRSPLANPHPVGKPCRRCDGAVHTLAESLQRYRDHLTANPGLLALAQGLRGRRLACWCPLDKPRHADVIAELADAAT
ncbi:hypothetical protein SRB5_39240 [Streptomyces sp. RB5]|uniref:DUF4326 domain-containing protein n=1 Tax=Streptomyces smaragdinus TaxID=2585196 RepID=A0A7K0CK44_9ACTN|nr:DUF4326 domain-containing protein [Streptomyces smaragdinus]MQY13771.1 hypothetical protein [Streptomyces smaragdinus]